MNSTLLDGATVLSDFAKTMMKDRYLFPGEKNCQERFWSVAHAYSKDEAHARRMYNYISKLWFMPATPILSNGGTDRGLPISCFVNEVSDDLRSISNTLTESLWLANGGGGIGTFWGAVRSVGEPVRDRGKAVGAMSFIVLQNFLSMTISQGSLRRGSTAVYFPMNHPEIKEFIDMRKVAGGDTNRKALNLHHGVVITDDFMNAVIEGKNWPLVNLKTGQVKSDVSARVLWGEILLTRVATGEPYILFIDTINRKAPSIYRKLGNKVKTSNLCSEITLATGRDHLGNDRTAVCCLGSMNLEYFDLWRDNDEFFLDIGIFMDKVLDSFIANASSDYVKAKYSAQRERSIGIGVLGWASALRAKGIPFDSEEARAFGKKVFPYIAKKIEDVSLYLGEVYGPCLDAIDAGEGHRFTHRMSIAPTASISIIANSSPGIDPITANAYTHKTLSGSFAVRDKHLAEVLERYSRNDPETWQNITINGGSVQHLNFLSKEDKEVYKTAFEIDQEHVILQAADRADYVCQSQSVNLFLPPDVHKAKLHKIHLDAWKLGIKSLYYLRSRSIQRADTVANFSKSIELAGKISNFDQEDSDECSVCQ